MRDKTLDQNPEGKAGCIAVLLDGSGSRLAPSRGRVSTTAASPAQYTDHTSRTHQNNTNNRVFKHDHLASAQVIGFQMHVT